MSHHSVSNTRQEIVIPVDCDAAPHWAAATGGRRVFGICVPVWSIRSVRSCGMGDLADLREFIDLMAECGVGLVQILPMNDAGLDGVPYSAISAFAIDPAFAALDEIPGLADDAWYADQVRAVAARFAGAAAIDNPAVRSARIDLLRIAYGRLRSAGREPNLAAFVVDNPWVDTYAAFKVLRERAGLKSWEDWDAAGCGCGDGVGPIVEYLRGTDDFRFHVFCQWLMDVQFGAVHRHARERGVLIEGDIPILVARDSADVWARPGMFHLEYAAGAPPDMYSEDGQHWGFPTYRWDVVRESGYAWWRARLRQAARYYDLYRIDHVVGFFRIWTVDVHAPNGREGWFDPPDEAAWGDHGRTILRMMLESTSMLPLAEDLGTIPPICRSTLREMGICGLKVQRWEKDWNGNRLFISPDAYEPLSVATLSTHDCEIEAAWWAAADQADRDELWALAGRGGTAPAELGGDDEMALLRWFAGVGSAFVVLGLQDVMHPLGLLPGSLESHRINLPGTVGRHNWSWRCPVETAGLRDNQAFVDALRELSRLTVS